MTYDTSRTELNSPYLGVHYTVGTPTSYTVDSNGKLTTITDPDSRYTGFLYDTDNRLKLVRNRNGDSTGFSYSTTTGKLAADTLPVVPIDAGGGSTSNGRPIITYSHWSASGVPSSATNVTPKAVQVRESAWSTITDPISRTTSIVTDISGQAMKISDPRGATTSIMREGLSPKLITGPDGNTDSLVYTNGLLTASKPAGGSWTYYQYGVFAQVDSAWGAAERPQQRFLQSGTGLIDSIRVTRMSDSVTVINPLIRFTYDTLGRRITRVDESGHVDSTFYDATTGNASGSGSIGGVRTTRTFDAYGRPATDSVTGQPKSSTSYDSMNRITQIDDGVNGTPTTFSYGPMFRRGVRNPKGELADSVIVDALGRVIQRFDTYNTSLSQTYRYDAAGQLTSTTNRRGQRVDRTYDNSGNLASRKYGAGMATVDTFSVAADGTSTSSANSISTVSTTSSRLTGFRQASVTLGGQTRIISHWKASSFAGRDSSGIGSSGSLTSIGVWTTAYDSYTGYPSWTKQFNDQYQQIVYKEFTNDGKPTDFRYGSTNGTRYGSRSYTARGASSGMDMQGGVSMAQAQQRDSLDRVRALVGNAQSNAYAYDGLGRLMADTAAQGSPFNYPGAADSAFGAVGRYSSPVVTQFSYDAAGNRTDNTGTYNTGNRIAGFKGYSFEHDDDGNITRKNGNGVDIRYRWDELGRLVHVWQYGTGDSVNYAYDALDRIVRRAVSGTVDQYWLWDGDNLVTEFNGSMAIRRVYRYEGTDRPVQGYYYNSSGSFNPTYAQVDGRGNVMGWADAAWVISGTTTYDAWGVPSYTGGSDTVSTLLWKGLHWEGGAAYGGSTRGAYFMRARWYDPELGRFLSEDPAGIVGGLNMYTFGGSDPINKKDPTGLRPLNDWELFELADICEDVDCHKINVHDGNEDPLSNLGWALEMTASGGRSHTLGYDIYIARGSVGDIATLAHELTHSVQYKRWGAAKYYETGFVEHWYMEAFEDAKLYRLPESIHPNERFANFSMEQQGQIVEDCFRGIADRCAISPYRRPSGPYIPVWAQMPLSPFQFR